MLSTQIVHKIEYVPPTSLESLPLPAKPEIVEGHERKTFRPQKSVRNFKPLTNNIFELFYAKFYVGFFPKIDSNYFLKCNLGKNFFLSKNDIVSTVNSVVGFLAVQNHTIDDTVE